SGVANTVDPMAGSYAVEAMTAQIEREAMDILDRIDQMGGTLVAIENGYIQQEIEQAAYRTQQAVDSGVEVVVGVNRFTDDEGHGAHAGVFRVDPDVEQRQIDRVRAVRTGRSPSEWKAAIEDIETAARGTDNLVPRIISA